METLSFSFSIHALQDASTLLFPWEMMYTPFSSGKTWCRSLMACSCSLGTLLEPSLLRRRKKGPLLEQASMHVGIIHGSLYWKTPVRQRLTMPSNNGSVQSSRKWSVR